MATILIVASALVAAGPVPNCYAAQERPDSGGETTVDEAQRKVSAIVLNSAEWLDSFFRDDTYEAESNTTRLKIKLDSFSEQDEGTELDLKFDLRLNLPGTENRLNLIIGSNPDDDPDADTPRDELAESDDDIKAALEYFFVDNDRQNLKLTGGVR
ncbi:MAG: hypothetical protein WBG37_15310 [Desulfobacterales bacterium]